MEQYYHTRGLQFSARATKDVGSFCVRGVYWGRPAECRDKLEVTSTQERWGYKDGGRFGSKEEATLNIEPFRIRVESVRVEECDGGGGGGGGAGRTKEYSAATRDTTRSGGRDEVVAEAGFAARKRPSGTSGKEQPGVKKQKLPESLQASVRARRAEKLAQVRAEACRKLGLWRRRHVRVMDWVRWRERVMAYLGKHIWEGTTWKLMDGGPPSIDDFSPHVIQLMQMKALVMHSFMFEMNERDMEEMAAAVKQVLWERGLWKDGMVLKVKPDDERGQDLCMQTTLHKCPDFNLEIGALTKLIQDEGHICLFCAKGHPEIAGLGIEYDWGVSKKIFRSKNDQVALHMQAFLDEALDAITLTIARKTARRARLYMRAYKTGKAHSHDLIEKFVKIHKCHRNILDQETKYLQKLVVLCESAGVKLEVLEREAETSGLKMYGAGGDRLLPPPAAAAAAAAAGAEDDAPAAEDPDSDSDADSIIGDAESSAGGAGS